MVNPSIIISITDEETGTTMFIKTDKSECNVPREMKNTREATLEALAKVITKDFQGYSRQYDATTAKMQSAIAEQKM